MQLDPNPVAIKRAHRRRSDKTEPDACSDRSRSRLTWMYCISPRQSNLQLKNSGMRSLPESVVASTEEWSICLVVSSRRAAPAAARHRPASRRVHRSQVQMHAAPKHMPVAVCVARQNSVRCLKNDT